ncbi:MAG: hypothetical protein ACTSYC_06190 [Promethearchaeota archaeon]
MGKNKEKLTDKELDELLDQEFSRQEEIHHKCKIRDDPIKKQRKWKEKYGI